MPYFLTIRKPPSARRPALPLCLRGMLVPLLLRLRAH